MIEPIVVDKQGTYRFLENKIISDLTKDRQFEGNYILNILYMAEKYAVTADKIRYVEWRKQQEKFVDDYRHFNQLLGYSVSGFGSLNIAHSKGCSENGYDGYIHHIDSLELTPEDKIKHPITQVVYNFNKGELIFMGNSIVKFMCDKLNMLEDFLKAVEDDKYSVEDRRQILQLIGVDIPTYFSYEFNRVINPETGISVQNKDLEYEIMTEYETDEYSSYGIQNDMNILIGKKVKTYDYDDVYEWDDQAPKEAFGKVGVITHSGYLENDQTQECFTIKFDEKISYFNKRLASDEWEFLRCEFDVLDDEE